MSEQPFLKCPCQSCGGSIEFPANGIGLAVPCPHCGHNTLLTMSGKKNSPVSGAIPSGWLCILLGVGALFVPLPDRLFPKLLVCGALLLAAFVLSIVALAQKRTGHGISILLSSILAVPGILYVFTEVLPAIAEAKHDTDVKRHNSRPTSLTTSSNLATMPLDPSRPKSINDLKPSAVTLEKAKSGNLFYAVGTVHNDSDHQRFGVKVEIEFTDAKGRPAGKATDYTQVIEPRKEWRFRALVLDSKAVAGKVVTLKEDN